MEIADSRVEEVARDNAAAIAVLNRHGIDICCGGGKTVREAATLHGVDLDELLGELEAAEQQTAGGVR
jgi:regulator of cell morphogenesis and NO signaling